MPDEEVKHVSVRCFYDGRSLEVPTEVFSFSDLHMHTNLADRGRIVKGYASNGRGDRVRVRVVVGFFGVYCRGCYDTCLGPRPTRTAEDELNELEKGLRGR